MVRQWPRLILFDGFSVIEAVKIARDLSASRRALDRQRRFEGSWDAAARGFADSAHFAVGTASKRKFAAWEAAQVVRRRRHRSRDGDEGSDPPCPAESPTAAPFSASLCDHCWPETSCSSSTAATSEALVGLSARIA